MLRAAAVFAFAWLGALLFWSCDTGPAEENIVTVRLDSARVGKFDSILVEIYNGQPPGPGDTAKPVQSEVIQVSPTTTEIRFKLDGNVEPDFSVVVTGYSGDEIAYRNQHTVEGFSSPDSTLPAVLLISRITAGDIRLDIGETRLPDLDFEPQNAGDKRVVLTSLDSDIVAVSGDSLKGLTAGTARVEVATPDGRVKASFSVAVAAVRVTDLLADTLLLKVGDTAVPDVKVVPENATDTEYSLESLDTALFRIEGKAVVGLAAGQGKLVLESHDGGAKDTIIVRVRIPVTGISARDMTVEQGDRFAPALEFEPADATRKGYALSSGDSATVAIVGEKDSLSAEAIGSATITVRTNDGGFTAEFKVEVVRKMIRVTAVTAEDLRALPGDSLAAEIAIEPADATEKGFTLNSLDTALVAADGGKIIAKALGKARVEAVSVDGGIKDTFEVAVELANFIQDIKPITSSKCAPCHVPPATFNWTDSAQLVHKGTIALNRLSLPDTAVGHMPLPGAAGGPITARELKILMGWLARVSVPLVSISVSDTAVNMGDTLAPPIVFNPGNASNQEFTLTSRDTNVVQVRGKLLVAAGVGSSSMDVLLDEGARHSQFKVTVALPSFQKNVLPITTAKCTPCHGPNQVFNWQDSAALISDGSAALDRLTRAPDAAGKMPLAGSPNGDLTPTELRILLTWLNSKVVPLKGITVPDDSLVLGSRKEPSITWNPPNATNKSFILVSNDTSKVGISGTEMVGKALGSGTTVEVRAIDGGFSELITVKVLPVRVDSLAVRDTGCAKDDSIRLKPVFHPANATDQSFTVKSLLATPKVKIDSGYKITGLTLGKDTLEATSTDGGKKARFVFTIGPVLPQSLSAADTNGTVSGALVTPRLAWNPASTTDKTYALTVVSGDTATVAAVRGGQMLPRTAVGKVSVEAKSNADPAVRDTFDFSVGPVAVAGLSVASAISNIGLTLAPVITWNPANATDKTFALSLAAGDTGLTVTGSGTTLLAKHLGSRTVTVTSTDGAKTAPWSVNIIRTSFTNNLLGITTAKCDSCHYAGSGLPNWKDSATVVGEASLIKTRIGLPLADGSHMPPGVQLPADTIAIITNWLNQN